MLGKTLFGDLGGRDDGAKRVKLVAGAPQVRRPDRKQSVLRSEVLDQLLPRSQQARAIVAGLEMLDWSALYEPIKARDSEPGRPATDPGMLVSP